MVQVNEKVFTWQGTATETFVLPAADDVLDVAQTVVEIIPIAAGSATLAASAAPVASIVSGAANVAWFNYPSMPATAAYQEIATGIAAIRLTITSGTWAINIRRGLD